MYGSVIKGDGGLVEKNLLENYSIGFTYSLQGLTQLTPQIYVGLASSKGKLYPATNEMNE
jgi:hypothetical protein